MSFFENGTYSYFSYRGVFSDVTVLRRQNGGRRIFQFFLCDVLDYKFIHKTYFKMFKIQWHLFCLGWAVNTGICHLRARMIFHIFPTFYSKKLNFYRLNIIQELVQISSCGIKLLKTSNFTDLNISDQHAVRPVSLFCESLTFNIIYNYIYFYFPVHECVSLQIIQCFLGVFL